MFGDRQAWLDWLALNHATQKGVWIRFAKAASGKLSVSYPEAVETALCFGWIDGQARSSDEETWLQKFTPRGKRSVWSKRNCSIAERLILEGAMQPSGLAAIEAAKQDGRWERAYDSSASATVPDDLQ